MKLRFILVLIYLSILIPIALDAQVGLVNGNMEYWKRGQFRCCGRNVDVPGYWGTPEEACGINFNKFVFIEDDPHNVHSGRYAARLSSDTSFFNNVGLQPGMLVYGGFQDPTDSVIRIGQPVARYGLSIDSNPTALTFWLKMSHDLSDTFTYTYLLTRWNAPQHKADTLAFVTRDIADTQVPQDQYFQVTDSVHYLMAGQADTAKVIFIGGRFGNTALINNTTWIDDIAFTYGAPGPTNGIAETHLEAFNLYPNPAANTLRIQAASDLRGEIAEIYDELGRMVTQAAIESPLQAIDISRLATGAYICRILDKDLHSLYQAKVSVVR